MAGGGGQGGGGGMPNAMEMLQGLFQDQSGITDKKPLPPAMQPGQAPPAQGMMPSQDQSRLAFLQAFGVQ